MNIQKKIVLFFTAILIVALVFMIVDNNPITRDRNAISDPYIIEGKQLATAYCSSCHKFPAPELLPWKTWRFETLPAMAPFLGVDDPNSAYNPNRNPYLPDNFYPSEPMVSLEDWQKIKDYYLQVSSMDWEIPENEHSITTDSLFFEAHFSDVESNTSPTLTSVKFDPGNRLIYASDFESNSFMVFNENLRLEHRLEIESTIANIQILTEDWQTKPGSRQLLLTFMGNLFPSDAPYGSVQIGSYNSADQISVLDSVLVSDITRPVESKFVDLDKNGQTDLLVNEFGHRAGSLFWIPNFGDRNQEQKKVLIDSPGCIQSYVMDFDNDEWPDVISLCTQTEQAIYLFSNRGNGQFNRSKLLEFEVTAGSSSFEIHDFNNDSYPDILYTSGDNADFSKVFKPYHGVYIYLNNGQNGYDQKWFYHMNGAYHARARDFDGDQDLDIAAISFFADYEDNPEEGFIYFENNGDFKFTPYHHPAATSGRWQTMDVGDWTGNGRDDIVLANFSTGPIIGSDSLQRIWQKTAHLLLLENKSKE